LKVKDTNEKTAVHLGRISDQVKKASGIIQNLLDVVKMKEPYREAIDIGALLEDVLERAAIPSAIKIVKNITQESCIVEADKEQLEMVFSNIITNAIQAMEGKGTLTVSLHTIMKGKYGKKYAEIRFHDTGVGIKPEDKERIFEPLFSTKEEGIGFGLTICKMIVNKNGGTISVESVEGEGATCIVTLQKK